MQVTRRRRPCTSSDDYFAIAEDFERDAEKVLNGIPDVVRQSMGFPYAVGPAFMATLDAYGGADAVAGAFATPPAHRGADPGHPPAPGQGTKHRR